MFQVLVEEEDAELEHADLENAGLIETDQAHWGEEMAPRRARYAVKLVPVLFAVFAVVFLIVGPTIQTPEGPMKADVEASTRLAGFDVMAYEAAAQSLKAIGSFGKNVETADTWVEGTNFSELLTAHGLEQQALSIVGLDGIQLRRKNNLRDGNPCPDDEEVFAGLCYQPCKVLTGGRYPIRTAAFSCCMKQPCSFFNSKFTSPMKICQGLDVGGHDKYGCPHSPGDCLLNEEFHMGLCYKQCAVLTDSKYPYRSSSSTCCKQNSYLPCLEPENQMTSDSFNVGGGVGDKVLEEEMGAVHPPIAALAEK